MPPRLSRPSLNGPKPKSAKARSRKRTLNAFAIASAEEPQDTRVRANRLGESDDGPQRKRQRIPAEELSENEDEEGALPAKRGKTAAKRNETEISEDSDSDGNRWRLGYVRSDEDSDLDSDEAFDSEDEHRFGHFSFNGSSKKQRSSRKKTTKVQGSLDLQEDRAMDNPSGDDDSLGEDAVDLAQMLDDYSDDSSKDDPTKDNDESSGSSGEDENEVFSNSSFSDEEDIDGDQMTKLQSLVASLDPDKEGAKSRTAELYDLTTPSAAGPISTEKFDINDLFNSSDPQLVKMTKKLGNLPKKPKKDPKLAPSLPKRQKDRIDRVAANEKTNQTLERWVDSVKHIRRAEHIQFPLPDPESELPKEPEHLLPAITTKPLSALESTVNTILLESGLAPEEENESGDELPTNEVTLQEVLTRRAELRHARELLFREEKKAKRIKKIKSKSYRRVHRKERERLAALDEGSEMDDEERDAQDRRRAEERMGAKHRDSKWAKQMKKSGRSIWDDEARSGVTEMARRGEELRKRIAGKMDENGSDDESSESSYGEGDEDDGETHKRRMKRTLDQLANTTASDSKVSNLSSMKFMLKAEEALKANNQEEISRIRRAMDGSVSSDQSDDENIGRKLFGPSEKEVTTEIEQIRNEFEELEHNEDDDFKNDFDAVIDPTEPSKSQPLGSTIRRSQTRPAPLNSSSVKKKQDNPKSKGSKHEIISKPDTNGWMTVTYNHNSEGEEDSQDDEESIISQTDILKRAFAGDDVEDEFEKEKQAVIADEDEKIIDNTMAGWGSWVGDGTSKREQKRAKGKVLSKQEGIKPENRKDAKLRHVIVNQKRVRKNVDYLASTLPFPFTNRAEYEKSIRMPIGTEWNVKRTYQENTKPRVLVKPGMIVTPMGKPLV
jgi:U3 small nucleolar RNA-associated protein 14